MRLRRAVTIVGIGVGVLLAVGLFAPLQFREYACKECGAYKPQLRVLYVPVLWRTGKPELWRYWLKHMDAKHSHQWVQLERTETTGLFIPRRHITFRSWGNCRWDIDERGMIRILQALPDARSRKRFVNALWDAGRDPHSRLVRVVLEAYRKDPDRTDWAQVLDELGSTTSGSRSSR